MGIQFKCSTGQLLDDDGGSGAAAAVSLISALESADPCQAFSLFLQSTSFDTPDIHAC
jgi:hypothetical protein